MDECRCHVLTTKQKVWIRNDIISGSAAWILILFTARATVCCWCNAKSVEYTFLTIKITLIILLESGSQQSLYIERSIYGDVRGLSQLNQNRPDQCGLSVMVSDFVDFCFLSLCALFHFKLADLIWFINLPFLVWLRPYAPLFLCQLVTLHGRPLSSRPSEVSWICS